MSDLREALRESARLLQRYVTETPPRHQPHMIAHEAEASIRASSAALAEPAQPMQFEPNIYGHGEPPRDPAHTDHGRHWDRTCPACNASIDYGSAEPAQEMTDGWANDACAWGDALNDAGWAFIEACPEKSTLLFNTVKPALRAAILKYAERVAADRASPGGAQVEPPKGWKLVPVEASEAMLEAGRDAVMARDVASQTWGPADHYRESGRSTKGIPARLLEGKGPMSKAWGAELVYHAMLAAAPQASLPPQGAEPDFSAMSRDRLEQECREYREAFYSATRLAQSYFDQLQTALAASHAPAPQEPALTEAQVLAIADKYGQRWKAPDEEGISFEKSHFFMFLADLLTQPLYASPAPGELAQQAPSESSAQGAGGEKV